MKLSIATLDDIDDILALHFKYQINSISEEDKKDGFVTTAFTKEQLTHLIESEQGIFIARDDTKVVAYVMSASWQFWSAWPIFACMLADLEKLSYLGQKITPFNSYQYGPVCVDKSVRGSGILETLFDFAREHMHKRYPILVTFINKINHRSFNAHTKKIGLEVIHEFEFNNNHYYELAYDTSKKLVRTHTRCGWLKLSDPIYVAYHDEEWGKPLHDDRALFELLCLETQSAGLSWLTVLKKREGYRKAFENFELSKVVLFGEKEIERILSEGEVIKSRPKIEAIIANAKLCQAIIQEFGSLDAYLWGYVGGKTIVNDVSDYRTAACTSLISDALTKDLKKRGFKFVGSTTIYAFMQACGMVNDHENNCRCK